MADTLSTGSRIPMHGYHDLPITCHILVTAMPHLSVVNDIVSITYLISSLRSIKYASGTPIRLE